MRTEVLQMKNICKAFGGVHALQNVSISLMSGEIHALIGENGAGKSTLLKILSGLFKQDSGEIFLKGTKMHFKNPQEAQNAGIAMVYQELTLLPALTVGQNIYLNNEPLTKIKTVKRKDIFAKTKKLLNEYEIDIQPDDLVGELSISQQQMVEILKILIRNPEIIIFDEPTSTLARKEVAKLFEIMNKLVEKGKTIVFISHRLEEVFQICSRVTVLKDGEFIITEDLVKLDHDKLIKLMVGRPLLSFLPPKAECVSKKKIFEVKGLYLDKKLYDISFDIKKGEVVGIAGLQGHGQTELLDCIAGIIPKNKGGIYIDSKEIKIKNPAQAIKAGIALVPEDRKTQGLMLSLSVRSNLAITSLRSRSLYGFIKKKQETLFVNDYIKKLSIKTPNAEQHVGNLSGGNQQKVVLGKELSIDPKVLLFNEPTRGIDVETKHEFYKLIRGLAKDGIAVVMYSSDLIELVGMSDKVIVMYEGAIKAVIDEKDICEENIMKSAVGMENTRG